jgi:1-phosphatidylinositol-4-phosphate 5-kinase
MPKRFGGDKHQTHNICRFMDYAPNTFNRIRRLFGISNDEFARSMGPDGLLASLVMGEMVSMTSLSS